MSKLSLERLLIMGFGLEIVFTHPSKSTAFKHISITSESTFASIDAGNAINNKNGKKNLCNRVVRDCSRGSLSPWQT